MTTITASRPQELIALIPFNLGFTPEQSAVMLALRGPRQRVGVTIRVDLHDTAHMADALVEHLRNDQARSAAVILYSDNPAATAAAYQHIAAAARSRDLPLIGAWHVNGDQYTTLTSNGTPNGPARPVNADTTVIAATLVAAGNAPRTHRDDLDITPAAPGRRAHATRARNNTHHDDPAQALTLWRAVRHATTVTATAAGTLATHLEDATARDAILCDLLDTTPDTADRLASGEPHAADTLIPRLFEPARSLRPSPGLHHDIETLRAVCALVDNAPARALLALLCWWDGNGAEANIHLDAAERLNPTHRLAHLLRETLQRGMAPGWIRANH